MLQNEEIKLIVTALGTKALERRNTMSVNSGITK